MEKILIPKKLRIFGEDWDVECNDNLTNTNGKSLWGLCCYDKKKIKLNSNLDNPLLVFLHEVAHIFGRRCYKVETNTSETFAILLSEFLTPIVEDLILMQNEKPKSRKQILKELLELRESVNKQIKNIRKNSKSK
ncbi:MAG: hypothetical protein OQK82_03490 [Candidatus Pacearchaeota archaeon]|nr:hypothetical protein [Candidatus Pacearchaeota archaeon]